MCAWPYEIWQLPRKFGAKCFTKCHEAGSLSNIKRPKTRINTYPSRNGSTEKDCSKVVRNESRSQINPIEHLWRDLKMAVGRRHPSNLVQLKQFVKEEWSKLPVERCRHLIEAFDSSHFLQRLCYKILNLGVTAICVI